MGKIFFKWDQDFNTGNGLIDEQHFNLVNIINDLFQLVISNEKLKIEKIGEISDSLSLYVREHFKTEKDLMTEFNVDIRHTSEHKKLHREFTNEISEFFWRTYNYKK